MKLAKQIPITQDTKPRNDVPRDTQPHDEQVGWNKAGSFSWTLAKSHTVLFIPATVWMLHWSASPILLASRKSHLWEVVGTTHYQTTTHKEDTSYSLRYNPISNIKAYWNLEKLPNRLDRPTSQPPFCSISTSDAVVPTKNLIAPEISSDRPGTPIVSPQKIFGLS